MPAPGDPAAMGAPTAPPMPGNMPAQGDTSAMGSQTPPPAMEMFTEKPFDLQAELSKSAEIESHQAANPVASAAPAALPPVEVEAHEPRPRRRLRMQPRLRLQCQKPRRRLVDLSAPATRGMHQNGTEADFLMGR